MIDFATYHRAGLLLACSLRLVGVTRVDYRLLDQALREVCHGSVVELPELRWLREFLHFGEGPLGSKCFELEDVLSTACFAEVACFDGDSYRHLVLDVSVELAWELLKLCSTEPDVARRFGELLLSELGEAARTRDEFVRNRCDAVTLPGRSPRSRRSGQTAPGPAECPSPDPAARPAA